MFLGYLGKVYQVNFANALFLYIKVKSEFGAFS